MSNFFPNAIKKNVQTPSNMVPDRKDTFHFKSFMWHFHQVDHKNLNYLREDMQVLRSLLRVCTNVTLQQTFHLGNCFLSPKEELFYLRNAPAVDIDFSCISAIQLTVMNVSKFISPLYLKASCLKAATAELLLDELSITKQGTLFT